MRRRWTVLAFVLVIGLVGAACGDDGGGDATTPPATDGGETTDGGGADLTMQGTAFEPTELTATSGDTLSMLNADPIGHTFTVEDTDIDQEFEGGASAEVTIDLDPGEYSFICRFHSNMTGTLTVS